MKILIISYFFYPEITPRATRAYNLYLELIKQGHDVSVLTCANESIKISGKNINAVKPGFLLNRKKRFNPGKQEVNVKSIISTGYALQSILSLYNKLFGGRTLESVFYMVRWFNKSKSRDYDIAISIGLPFASHLAAVIARRMRLLNTRKLILDYGDPYSKNVHMNMFFTAKWLEKWVLKNSVDAISVPIDEAKYAFKKLFDISRIHVVPQGFDIEADRELIKNMSRNTCREINDKLKIVYAGNFYEGIRNPIPFFSRLPAALKEQIYIELYIDKGSKFNMDVVEFLTENNFNFLCSGFVDRQEILRILASANFLLDFKNNEPGTKPSKLIDYAIANTPVISVDPTDSSSATYFGDIINGNSCPPPILDLAAYNIKYVAKKFLEIAEND